MFRKVKDEAAFRKSGVAVAMTAALSCLSVNATEKLNMSFIHGGANAGLEEWAELSKEFAPGRYLIDVFINGKDTGKKVLDITPADSNEICFSEEWLSSTGIYLRQEFFRDSYDSKRQCYILSRASSVTVDFDVSTQKLALSIPQVGLSAKPENQEWDYGGNAFRVNYNVNANTGRDNTGAYASADLMANVGRWVINSTVTASGDDSGNKETSVDMFTATRAVRSLNADLAVGKTQTGNNLLGSVGTYGLSLSHNNSMKPGNLGYKPVFSGIANGPARVTLVQNGRTLYSEMMPSGPFSITDVPLYTSGDVIMTVTGEDGKEQTQIFPLSVMNNQLSPGQHEFSVAAGIPDEQSSVEGEVLSASYGYGLNDITFRLGGIWNQNYYGVSSGIVTGLGRLGALSADMAYASAKNSYNSTSTDNKFQMGWHKQFEATKTGLRLSWSRQGENYEDLSSYDPKKLWRNENRVRAIKDEWNAGISQPVGDIFNVSVSGWQRKYYPNKTGYKNITDNGKDSGISGSLSTQIKGVNLNLGASGSKNSRGENNWAVSASVSVPFTLFDRKYNSSTSVSRNKGSGTALSTGVSGQLNDRFSYGFGGGLDGDGGTRSYLSSSYSGNQIFLSGMLNQSSSGGTSGSLSANGSVLALPGSKDVILSRTTGDTIAVIKVEDIPGVKVKSGNGETDRKGNLVVPLNSYDQNIITIDASTLPKDIELSTTSKEVVPAEKAVITMPFDSIKVKRYLLQIRNKNGEFVQGGLWARDSKNTPLGFVANNGVLMINAVDALGDITVGSCRISGKKIQQTEKLQEINCD
ncbi:PefC/AfrB family outer membrane usher protein [Escherichia coli]|nr:PefC/AfrB family outer membrane usher protein [Escherichia coli]EJA1216569.1 PefC/AfrB family outer membrane usher protein [Escherichia coli]HAW3000211.1 PefC/AfrB family outer membrane usher protein [Escherichia coli]